MFKNELREYKRIIEDRKSVSSSESSTNPLFFTMSSSSDSISTCSLKSLTRKKNFDYKALTLLISFLFVACFQLHFSIISADLASSSNGGWDVWWAYDGIAGKIFLFFADPLVLELNLNTSISCFTHSLHS